MSFDLNPHQNDDFLDICERSLRKYMAFAGEEFEVDHALLMLECMAICKTYTNHPQHSEIICYLCASICIDCLDPSFFPDSEVSIYKQQQLYQYIKDLKTA